MLRKQQPVATFPLQLSGHVTCARARCPLLAYLLRRLCLGAYPPGVQHPGSWQPVCGSCHKQCLSSMIRACQQWDFAGGCRQASGHLMYSKAGAAIWAVQVHHPARSPSKHLCSKSRCSNLWAGCVHAELDPMFHLSMQRSSNGMEWLRVHAYVCRVRVCMQTCVQVVGAEKALTHKLATLGVCSECITFLLKGPRRGHCCTHRAALCSCRLSIVTHVSLIATWSAPALPHSHRRIVFKAAPWHLVPWRHSS